MAVDINQTLEEIKTAIDGIQCTCPDPITQVSVSCGACGPTPGSGGAGGGPIVDPPATGTAPPVDQGHCDRAAQLVDDFGDVLGSFITFESMLSLDLTAIVGTWIANLPDLYSIFALAGDLLSVLYEAAAYQITSGDLGTQMNTWEANWNGQRDAIICDLYGAADIAAARSVLQTRLTGTKPAALSSDWVDLFLAVFFPNNVLNGLHDGWTGITVTSVGNCSGCGETFVIQEGSYIGGNTYQSQLVSGIHYVTVYPDPNASNARMTCDPSNYVGFTAVSPSKWVRHNFGESATHYNDTDWPVGTCGNWFRMRSSTSFTVDLAYDLGAC